MTRILTVDDSRAIRSIVSKQCLELGFEIDEAEDGEQGLARLEECEYDLVLLDVTMPVLDGPGMLERMRAAGNTTKVLMLTSESKRSVVAGVMKSGIEDYILKPWKPEELRAKLTKILKLPDAPDVAHGAGAPTIQPASLPSAAMPEAATTAGKQFIDVLLIDDMENVGKKLRASLPPHISLGTSVSAQSALATCRDKIYRVILLDTEIPDVNSPVLMAQLRMLQGHAAVLALALRTGNDAEKEAKQQGFDGVMLKPFDKDSIEDFLLRYFDNQELLSAEDNIMKVGSFTGKEDRLDRYFSRVSSLIFGALEKVAAACFEQAILDISKMPQQPDRMPRLILDIDARTRKAGMQLRVVGSPELATLLTSFTDTAAVPFFASVDQAKAA